MPDNSKFDREFLRAGLSLASKAEVDHLLFISDDPIEAQDLRGRKCRRKLIYAVTSEELAAQLIAQKNRALVTLMQTQIGGSLEDRVAIEGVKLGDQFNSQVVDALIQVALQVGQQGFEGHPIGTIITVGDHTNVLEKSRQLTINPFQGLSEAERNVLDPKIREAIKNFSVLDGAFVIREDGVVLAAGRYLAGADESAKIPMGLGTRHAAASQITSSTECIALAVSQSSGAVRLFKNGEIVLELQQTARRV